MEKKQRKLFRKRENWGNSQEENRGRCAAAGVLITGAGVLFLPMALQNGGKVTAFSNSFLAVLVFALLLPVVRKAVKRQPGGVWDWLPAGLAGFGFAAAVLFGRQLEEAGFVTFTDGALWLALFFLGLLFTCLWQGLFQWLEVRAAQMKRVWEREKQRQYRTDAWPVWQRRLLCGAGLFLAWLPVLLAVYPGFFVYDAQDEYLQVVTRQFTNQHPLLHVLLLGGIIQLGNKVLGSVNAGIVCYMLFQMTVLASVFSWLLGRLKEWGVSRGVRIVSFLFLAFFPVIPMYVLCSSKDGLYTAAMLGAMIRLVDLGKDREAFLKNVWKMMSLAACLFGMAAFRNNGFYVVLVMIPVLIWFAGAGSRNPQEAGRKARWKRRGRMAAVLGVVLLSYLGMNQLFGLVLHPVDVGTKELFTVPIQQLARTYVYSPETFDEDETAALLEILPKEALQAYRGKLSDPVKIQFQADAYEKDPQKYRKLWLEVGLKSPFSYANAWLLTSYGFWYPDAVIDVYRGNGVFTFTYEDSSYFGFETEEPGVRESKFPWLEEVYRKLSLELYQQKVPVVSMLFSPGFLFWVYVTAFLYLLKRRKLPPLLVLLPAALNWLTVILGPTYLVRYVLIFWFALPLLPALSDSGNCDIVKR